MKSFFLHNQCGIFWTYTLVPIICMCESTVLLLNVLNVYFIDNCDRKSSDESEPCSKGSSSLIPKILTHHPSSPNHLYLCYSSSPKHRCLPLIITKPPLSMPTHHHPTTHHHQATSLCANSSPPNHFGMCQLIITQPPLSATHHHQTTAVCATHHHPTTSVCANSSPPNHFGMCQLISSKPPQCVAVTMSI